MNDKRITVLPLTNVALVSAAVQECLDHAALPSWRLCLYGPPYGKSSAARAVADEHRGIYIKVLSVYSVEHIATKILGALGVAPAATPMFRAVAATTVALLNQVLAETTINPRLLTLDFVDYLSGPEMAAIVKTFSTVVAGPMVLIGGTAFRQQLRYESPTAYGQVTRWIEAQPPTLADCRMLADRWCPEAALTDAALEDLNARVDGDLRHLCFNLPNGIAKAA